MKKILFLLFIAIIITGCEKDEERAPVDSTTDEKYFTAEKIFNKTGCKPTNIENLKTLHLYKDKDSTKYLYGSKYKDKVESFWVAQYNSSGDQVWEVIKKDTEASSHAYGPKQINNGSIVITNVTKIGDFDIKGATPVLLTTSGKANFINIFKNYYYTDIHPFDDFFFCDIDPTELAKLPNAKKWCVQFSNDGKIINQAESMSIPDGKVLWTSDSTYINMNFSLITRGSLLDGPYWTYPVNLPKHENCDMKISMEGDDINAIYYLTSPEKNDTLTYKLSYTTGKDAVRTKGISIDPKEKGLIIGEEFILTPIIYPEDASIKDVVWKSSNESIAIINESGKVKAISKGECTIVVITKDGGFEATSKIRVTSESEVNGIYFPEPTIKIIIGSTYKLNAVVTPLTALNKNIKWSSSDNHIVSIDNNGIATANTMGDATITAETEEGGYKATCEIITVDIKDFITLNFSAQITSFINGYVTGNIYSQLTNNSSETINVTGLTVVDTGTHRIIATADKSLLGDLEPNSYFSIGGAFYSVYYPMFIWEYEYKGKKYSSSHTLFKESFSSFKSTTKNKNGLIWLDK